jgi:Ca2+-binding EF-hand superfamily protein
MTTKFSDEELSNIKKIFDQFDKNNSGTIDKKELLTLSIALNNPLSNASLHSFFREIDLDNSSQISWEEFITYWGN